MCNELRELAARKMAQERPGHTLQPTALVNEVWLRLVGDCAFQFEESGAFLCGGGQGHEAHPGRISAAQAV
ncbi:MAG: ECF-type sigma factor [Verrucomicrobiota bacterium]